jgi:hypothetical protein
MLGQRRTIRRELVLEERLPGFQLLKAPRQSFAGRVPLM